MPHQKKRTIYWIIASLMLLCIHQTYSQEEAEDKPYYERQIELTHDNDFLLFTDWYYTTGSFITYRQLLNDIADGGDKSQLRFTLSQIYYTPSAIKSERIEEFDRPYAGYTSLSTGLNYISERRILDFRLELGVSGAISGAEGFQSWFHSTNESSNPTWIGQIEDAVHANLYVEYVRDWELLPKPFGVHVGLKPSLALGTRDLYLQHETAFYFGKRAAMHNSMAYRQLGDISPEFFFGIHFTYRYVMYDALLEGSPLSDNSIFTLNPINNLFFYGINGYFRKKRMEYMVGYNYVSRRAPTTQFHTWVKLSISRNF